MKPFYKPSPLIFRSVLIGETLRLLLERKCQPYRTASNEGEEIMEKPVNYVVVELAGTECEHVVRECSSFKAASQWFAHQYRYGDAEECGALIMKVREDGTRTTEY